MSASVNQLYLQATVFTSLPVKAAADRRPIIAIPDLIIFPF